jgi:Protein of unknown function (DUF2281)
MGAAILEQLQKLPEPMQKKALEYIEALVAEHHQGEKSENRMSRKDAFGIWKDQIWMAEDFDAPLEDLKEYM